MVPTETPFILTHTVRLSPAEVLDALRQAALAQVRGMLGSTAPVAGSVELDTRVLPNGAVEIDGAAVTVTAKLPEQLLAILRNPPTAPNPKPGMEPGWALPN